MLSAFLFAAFLSFWGSLPPGPGNLSVFHTVLNKNTRSGIWVAFGACLPEIPYSFIAIVAVHYMSTFEKVKVYLGIATIVVTLGIGLMALFQPPKEIELHSVSSEHTFHIHPFWKGILVGLLNPMLIPFWLVTSEMAVNLGWLHPHDQLENIGFIIGTAVGAFFLLVLIAFFTKKIRGKITPKIVGWVNKGIGLTFITLAVIQAVKIFNS